MAHSRLVLALVVGVAALVGCNKPKGSCDRRADKDKTCTEVLASTIKDTARMECAENPTSHAKGTWSDGPCPHEDAIAGCETSLSRDWYYPGALGGRVTSPSHVAQMCDFPGATLVDAKGKKLTGVTKEKLSGEATDREVEDATAKPNPKLDAVLAGVAKIKVPSGAPSGTIHPSGGKVIGKNAASVWDSDLTAMGISTIGSTATYPFHEANDLRACAAAVKMKKRLDPYSGSDVKKALDWCPTLEFLLVVKATKMNDADTHNGLQFKGGTAEGYVYAFELPSGNAIGGYAWKAESSAKVKEDEIHKDFRANIVKALDAGLKKASPTSTYDF